MRREDGRWSARPDVKNIEVLQAHFRTEDAPEPDTTNLDALIASLNGPAERFQIAGHGAQPG